MTWARVAVVLGALALLIGFGVGVQTPISTTVAGQSYECADVIPADVLVSGQSASRVTAPDTRTATDRRLAARVDAACAPLERRARWAVWGGLGLGGLVLLAGSTALREHEHDEEGAARRTEVPAGA